MGLSGSKGKKKAPSKKEIAEKSLGCSIRIFNKKARIVDKVVEAGTLAKKCEETKSVDAVARTFMISQNRSLSEKAGRGKTAKRQTSKTTATQNSKTTARQNSDEYRKYGTCFATISISDKVRMEYRKQKFLENFTEEQMFKFQFEEDPKGNLLRMCSTMAIHENSDENAYNTVNISNRSSRVRKNSLSNIRRMQIGESDGRETSDEEYFQYDESLDLDFQFEFDESDEYRHHFEKHKQYKIAFVQVLFFIAF